MAAILAASTLGCTGQSGQAVQTSEPAAPGRGDILIDGTGVHPESVTSDAAGALYVGSINGTIYRAGPTEDVARPFITPSEENGLRTVFGVLADDRQKRLWVCSVNNPFVRTPGPPAPSEVVAFELESGALVGRWAFPAPGGTCNDIAIAADGAAYATDTPGGRILRLAPGGTELEVVASDERLRGIDGIAFEPSGSILINNVQTHALWRVKLSDGSAPELTELRASRAMEGPDGLRPLDGNRYLQAEGPGGRVTIVTIEGDEAHIEVIREGLDSSPGVTLIGDTAYAVEGKIQYLFSPEFRGQDPGPFRAVAIPLPR